MGYFLVILSAVIFGSMPLLTLLVQGTGLSVLAIVFFRYLLMVPVFGGLLLLKTGKISVPGGKSFAGIFLTALFGATLTSSLLFYSYNYMPTGIATIYHFSYPVFVLVLEVALFHQRVSAKAVRGFVLCVSGLILLSFQGTAGSWIGAVLAIGSGITFAVYIVLIAHTRQYKSMDPIAFIFWFAICGSVLNFAVSFFSGQLELALDATGWVQVITYSLVVGSLATFCFQVGIKKLGGIQASFLSTLEPAISVLLGGVVLHESLTFFKIVGISLILLSVLSIMSGKQKVSVQSDP